MKRFRSRLSEDVYSLYSLPISADLSESELKPYLKELTKVIILESREKNLIIKVKVNEEIDSL